MKQNNTPSRKLFTTSVLLALLALVSVTAATAAWMTIADRTRVRSMRMDITTGVNLRFDLDPHETFEEYVKTLTFDQIAQRIKDEKEFDPLETPLTPVTTKDCEKFTLEDGSDAKTEYYLEFTLHFMATQDMIVHLTSADSDAGEDGTQVSSETAGVPDAIRISFTAEETSIYDPGMGGGSTQGDAGRTFGLPEGNAITYNGDNELFSLKANEDKPVILRVWLEGNDEACTDAIRKADYKIRLRFVGTDENGNLLEGSRRTAKEQSN